MPCRSDYLGPYEFEKENQRAAKFIIWLSNKLDLSVPKWIKEEGKKIYARDERTIPELCKILKRLKRNDSIKFEAIVYDAHNFKSRELADWWERHLKADRDRKLQERKEFKENQIKKNALDKLSKKEREVLGL
jgi:hypothetical protein